MNVDALLYVDVADDAGEQRRGLSGIEQLPADEGMAFVWPEPVGSTFWMKDTLIPLSIAFVDEAGRVIDVLDMQPCESDPCPTYGVDEPYVLGDRSEPRLVRRPRRRGRRPRRAAGEPLWMTASSAPRNR